MSSSNRAYSKQVALDAAGNAHVRGVFEQNLTITGAPPLVAVASPANTFGKNMFLARFDNGGDVILPIARSTGAAVDEGGVGVDQAGSVYVTGWFDTDSIAFGGSVPSLTSLGRHDAFVVKYNNAGVPLGVPQWAKSAGGQRTDPSTHRDLYFDCAVDGAGNVYTSGVLGSGAVSPTGSGGGR